MVIVNQTLHPETAHWLHSYQQLAKKASLGALGSREHLFSLFMSERLTGLHQARCAAIQALSPYESHTEAQARVSVFPCGIQVLSLEGECDSVLGLRREHSAAHQPPVSAS